MSQEVWVVTYHFCDTVHVFTSEPSFIKPNKETKIRKVLLDEYRPMALQELYSMGMKDPHPRYIGLAMLPVGYIECRAEAVEPFRPLVVQGTDEQEVAEYIKGIYEAQEYLRCS